MISFRAVSKATVGLMALLGVGVVASAEGCGPGDSRYYCDSTGCFSCDGYGCSPVTAPTPQTCTGNKACASGETCTDKGCLKQCKVDTECAKGTVCLANFCQAPGSTTPPTPKQCTSKADCSAGEQCAAGKCQACGGTNGPCACAVFADKSRARAPRAVRIVFRMTLVSEKGKTGRRTSGVPGLLTPALHGR